MQGSERGSALLDLIIGTAVTLVTFTFLVTLLHTIVAGAASHHAILTARTGSDHLFERMRSEAESAWAISVPAFDVTGHSNADDHEVDFATEDATRQTYHWAYSYNAAQETVTRYTVAPDQSPQPGESISGITSFQAQAYPANAIGQVSSPIYDPLFANTSITPVAYELDDGTIAGNGFVAVSLTAAGTSHKELFATGLAPTQFTVIVQYTPTPSPTP